MTTHKRALNHYGEPRQLLKCAEEAAELAAAIARYMANPTDETTASLIEEAADMENCIPYFHLIFGELAIGKAKEFKLQRLEKNLNDNFNFGA